MKNLVVLSGAGISAESGFSTFRDSGGYWDKYPVEQVATPAGWRENPALVNDFYNKLRTQQYSVKPNRAHVLLAGMEKDFRVVVVTQNVDNLHERAGSKYVIHLHGELDKVCSSRSPNDLRYIKRLDRKHCKVKLGDLAPDGSQFRPFIVWFGEPVPRMDEAIAAAQAADIFLIIGTSLNVYPAAGLLDFVRPDAKIYLIDPKKVPIPAGRNVRVIQEKASPGMEIFAREIRKNLPDNPAGR